VVATPRLTYYLGVIFVAEELFGKPGIDTPYEREVITYHPVIERPENERFYKIPPQIIQKIERAKDFTISKSLSDYDQLIGDIENLMDIIEQRNQTADFADYKKSLEAGDYKKILEYENKLCGYRGSGDAEIYTMLYHMKKSCVERRNFIDQYFRSQITNEQDFAIIQQKETEMIDQWAAAESQFIQLTEDIREAYRENYHDDDDGAVVETNNIAYLEDAIYNTEIDKKMKESLHTSLADTSYIHRNRTVMFSRIIDQLRFLVIDHRVVMKGDLKQFILMVSKLTDLASAKSHLILSFTQYKDKFNDLKGQYKMIDDQKENFISKQQWFYQQLESKSNHQLRNWLYNQPDNNEAFNAFATIIVDSLKTAQDKYDGSIVDLLRFYQQEAFFYDQQVIFIQKKEEIRQFLRILEDLEGLNEITEEWAIDYLKVNGYQLL
jgi:hypothetical protein